MLLFTTAAPAFAVSGAFQPKAAAIETADSCSGVFDLFKRIVDWFRAVRDWFAGLFQKETTVSTVTLELPPAAETGKQVTAFVSMGTPADNYNYYVVDWGDGTWSYNGPYVYAADWPAKGEVYHTYKQAGSYQVKACGVNLAAGTFYGWTEPQTLDVGGDVQPSHPIADGSPICSSSGGRLFAAGNIADGKACTRWQSAAAKSADTSDYIGYLFDDVYTLELLEIDFPKDLTTFPSNVTIEYTTDGGKTWYMLPHYYYVLPNSEGLYACVMNFPNPKGKTLSLPLDGIAANGVRFRGIDYLASD